MASYIYLIILVFKLCVLLSSSGTSNDTVIARVLEEIKNTSKCGEVYIDKQFFLKSPNYPGNYSENLECHFLLKGPHCPTYFTFNFHNFSLQNSENCTDDSFVVGNEDILCGNKNGTKTYFAKNGSLHVRFKTNGEVSDKGYLINVTRMKCEKISENMTVETATEIMKNTSLQNMVSTDPSIETRIFLPNTENKNTHCCGTIYDTKRFIITSPNFPYTLNKKTECTFEIRKVNDNICRLRLNFKFFWLGYTNRNNCPHGYLEIDGKYICGCNIDLKLTTTFEHSNVKLLRFKTDGYYQSYKSGFVLEVIQDECPKKYSPEDPKKVLRNSSKLYEIYNDQISRVARPTESQNIIEKLQLINERTEILDYINDKFQNMPKVIKSFYYFAPPEYNDISPLHFNKEKTTFLDLNSVNSVLTNSEYFMCLNWNQRQYNVLNGMYGSKLECSGYEENAATSGDNCVDLYYVNGYFRSPGYPCYYPGNSNICYRLRKQAGYCALKIFVQDFQIEDSVGCTKDYFLLANGEKHCGNSLNKASWTIDLRNKDYEDMMFVTDDYYCARGFSGVYQQIACQDEFPIHPVDTTTPAMISTTPNSDYCNKIIRDKSFVLEINQDHMMCTFTVHKFEEDVCKINFYFEKFDLVCAVESLVIDGTMYCGHLTGRVIKVNLKTTSTDIIYRSTLEKKFDDERFKIRGEQISDDCLFVEPPDVQRLISVKPEPLKVSAENSLSQSLDVNADSKYLIAFVNKNFKDICAIVTNSTEKELPSSFCDILTNDHNATKCMPLTEMTTNLNQSVSSDVPYTTKKLGIELQEKGVMKEIEELDIQEIDCDNLNI